MSSVRIIFASMLSCILLLAGLLIGSIRPAHTTGAPAGRQCFANRITTSLSKSDSLMFGPGSLIVPQGKTMFVEYASCYMYNISPGHHFEISIIVYCKTLPAMGQVLYSVHLQEIEIPMPGSILHMIAVSQPIGIHLSAGDALQAQLRRPENETGRTQEVSLVVSGYLE